LKQLVQSLAEKEHYFLNLKSVLPVKVHDLHNAVVSQAEALELLK
jgi:hypothetical protein